MTTTTRSETPAPRHIEKWLITIKIITLVLVTAMMIGIVMLWRQTITIKYPVHVSATRPAGRVIALAAPIVAGKLHKGRQLLLITDSGELPAVVRTIMPDETGNEMLLELGIPANFNPAPGEKNPAGVIIVSRRTIGDYVLGRDRPLPGNFTFSGPPAGIPK